MSDSGYRLVSFRAANGAPRAGLKIGERIYPAADCVTGLADANSVLGILREWDKAQPLLDAAAKKADPNGGLALSDVTLLAPILYPGALYCAGANYWDHLEEMA